MAGFAVGLAIGIVVAQLDRPPETTSEREDRLLDGAAQVEPSELADLAMHRARLGASWLAGIVRDDGSFYYVYDPADDAYEEQEYNEIRHAGTTYSLFQAYGALGDEEILAAANEAARYIEAHSETAGDGRAFVYDGTTKLGGQALALVALLERRRVTSDQAYDPLIDELAGFLLSMEMPDEPGRYFQSYDVAQEQRLPDPDSDFYPGEALLALTRLAQHFPDGPYLAYAVRAAEYLVHVRDGDIPRAGAIPREDHWLTLALNELHRLHPDDDYRSVAFLQAESMVEHQYSPGEADPTWIGASALRSPINYTSTATKGEALMASWALASLVDDADAAARFSAAALRNVQFQMRVQYTDDNTALFPRPEALVGAWGQDATEPYVRMDFVQHNISALIGFWHMAQDGDLPVARPGGGPDASAD